MNTLWKFLKLYICAPKYLRHWSCFRNLAFFTHFFSEMILPISKTENRANASKYVINHCTKFLRKLNLASAIMFANVSKLIIYLYTKYLYKSNLAPPVMLILRSFTFFTHIFSQKWPSHFQNPYKIARMLQNISYYYINFYVNLKFHIFYTQIYSEILPLISKIYIKPRDCSKICQTLLYKIFTFIWPCVTSYVNEILHFLYTDLLKNGLSNFQNP